MRSRCGQSAGKPVERGATGVWFLAGLVEGEGSWCMSSIKRHPAHRLGYYFQPEFFIYQHRVRRELLELAHGVLSGRPDPPETGQSGRPGVLRHYPGRRSRSVCFRFSAPTCATPQRTSDYETLRVCVVDPHESRQCIESHDGLARIARLAYSMNMKGKQRRSASMRFSTESSEAIRQTLLSRSEEMVRSPWRHGELGGTETT